MRSMKIEVQSYREENESTKGEGSNKCLDDANPKSVAKESKEWIRLKT
jgi:hypothetical protein